jgi:hypothetical protein
MISKSTWLKAAALSIMVWGATAATGCAAELDAEPAYYPPPAYIATASPVYYQGRPAYYYNSRWYFRGNGGGWGYYRSEPSYLYQQRTVYGAPAHAYVRGGGGRVVVRGR